jgi:hypothetical protein
MSKLTFNNISLYIKRVELHLTSNFIINAFNNNNIGIVKEVKFTKKTDNSGKDYNGAIIIFERWFTNTKVNKLLDDMNNSEDGSTKFIYDKYGHYWYINIYNAVMPESQQVALIDSTLPDKQRIIELEKLLQNMTTQMYYMQTRNEFNERQLMEYEQKRTYHYLCNVELRSLLEEKEAELDEINNNLNNEINVHLGEISMLKCRLACMSISLVRKDEECIKLKQELSDEKYYIKTNNEQNMDMDIDLPNISKMTSYELN